MFTCTMYNRVLIAQDERSEAPPVRRHLVHSYLWPPRDQFMSKIFSLPLHWKQQHLTSCEQRRLESLLEHSFIAVVRGDYSHLWLPMYRRSQPLSVFAGFLLCLFVSWVTFYRDADVTRASTCGASLLNFIFI